MAKYFVGNDTHFTAFSRNLFKHEQCIHVEHVYQLKEFEEVHKVSGEPLPKELENIIMDAFMSGGLELSIIPESTLYKKIM